MKRIGLWSMLVIGVALVVVPLATGMFGKATAGQRMMKAFQPVMSRQSVAQSANDFALFKGVGRDFGPIMAEQNVARFEDYVALMGRMHADVMRFIPALATSLNMTPDQVQRMLATDYPSLSRTLGSLDQIQGDMGAMVGTMRKDVAGFGQVAPALDRFAALMAIMESQVANYAEANSLPPMGLLPWFFVVPGALIALISASMLVGLRRRPVAQVTSHPALGRAA